MKGEGTEGVCMCVRVSARECVDKECGGWPVRVPTPWTPFMHSLLPSPYLSGGGGYLYMPFFHSFPNLFKNLGLGVVGKAGKVAREESSGGRTWR